MALIPAEFKPAALAVKLLKTEFHFINENVMLVIALTLTPGSC